MGCQKGNPLIDLARVHDDCKWTVRAMTEAEIENSTTSFDFSPQYCMEIGGVQIWATSEELDEFLEWFEASERKT